MRGDSPVNLVNGTAYTGSPPRAWGQLRRGPGDGDLVGFTPTCVGTALTTRSPWPGPGVHPHVRGDSDYVAEVGPNMAGSPPRAWGQHHGGQVVGQELRFTPTCVGTARSWGCCSWLSAVHPHVRGDSTVRPVTWDGAEGSPPRAWGQRVAALGHGPEVGFTPTCVGTALPQVPTALPRRVHPHVRGDSGRRRCG